MLISHYKSKNIAESSSRLMEERFDGRVSSERQDMAHQIFQIYEEKGEKVDFGWGDVQQESFGALFAGSDTTAISFRSLFYHLMHTPAAYEKLQAEIDQAFEDGRLSEIPTFQEASKLPYLDACIKEGLRVYPGAQLCEFAVRHCFYLPELVLIACVKLQRCHGSSPRKE